MHMCAARIICSAANSARYLRRTGRLPRRKLRRHNESTVQAAALRATRIHKHSRTSFFEAAAAEWRYQVQVGAPKESGSERVDDKQRPAQMPEAQVLHVCHSRDGRSAQRGGAKERCVVPWLVHRRARSFTAFPTPLAQDNSEDRKTPRILTHNPVIDILTSELSS